MPRSMAGRLAAWLTDMVRLKAHQPGEGGRARFLALWDQAWQHSWTEEESTPFNFDFLSSLSHCVRCASMHLLSVRQTLQLSTELTALARAQTCKLAALLRQTPCSSSRARDWTSSRNARAQGRGPSVALSSSDMLLQLQDSVHHHVCGFSRRRGLPELQGLLASCAGWPHGRAKTSEPKPQSDKLPLLSSTD